MARRQRLARVAGFGSSLAALLGLAGAVAAAPGLSSTYSDISPGRCGAKPARAPADHEAVRQRCRLLGLFGVEIVYGGTSVAVTLQGSEGPPARLGAGYAVGDRIEWRGLREAGRFVPRAAIVRLSSRDPAGRVVSALAVLRVEGGRVCAAGVLDAAGRDANLLAREAADRAASGPACAETKLAVIGPETEITREILDRSR